MILNRVPHVSASMILASGWKKTNSPHIIVTDDALTFEKIRAHGHEFISEKIRPLFHIWELLSQTSFGEGIFLIEARNLSANGNTEEILRNSTLRIERGAILPINLCIEKLTENGYKHQAHLEENGHYTREGPIIRIKEHDREYIIEYFENEIDSIIERWEKNIHLPSLILPNKTHAPTSEKTRANLNEAFLEFFSTWNGLLIGCEFYEGREKLANAFKEVLEFSMISRESGIFSGATVLEIADIIELQRLMWEYKNFHVISRYTKRVKEFLQDNSLEHVKLHESHAHIESTIFWGENSFLDTKWRYSDLILPTIIIGDDIISKVFIQNRIRKTSVKNLDLLLSIREWDHVVHREHGIGKYHGLLEKQVWLIKREYIEIEYDKNAKIFVPITELSRITKYIWEREPVLSSLEWKSWEKTLSKTDEEIALIAAELLETSAKRLGKKWIRFGSFPKEELLFQKAFPHEHTKDQISIIEEIRAAMEDDAPMDHLIAWDVGFGKTEIAMNAIYKAVLSGMQVACLSPLLILAEEHRETFEERLGAFGVRIASLTRLSTKQEEKKVLEWLQNGTIDVVVGTHRLMSDDVVWRKLGLLIIDEEHRFWVGQKERIKKMKTHIDIISLSATPIPRSLNMALSGLKKISMLTTPPKKKQPIETLIMRWDLTIVTSAITTEIKRGGQVIVLHNRIRSIEHVREDIEEAFRKEWKKKPRIIVTHGSIAAEDIEARIHDFKHGKYDVLISTTVIENGVNFLSANTIIISDAETFWLAELHQIRGRVGRKDIAWICYLTYRKYELSAEERQRLMILAEHSALGSGFEIAMRDMQMRGTGDILGFRQSWKTKEVWISLYFQLLEEKIAELKFGTKKEEKTKIELDISYVIPSDFFESEQDKVSFFRDIDSIETLEDIEYAENTFKWDAWPEEMNNLFLLLKSSILFGEYSVKKISKIGSFYHFEFNEWTTPEILKKFLTRFDRKRDMIISSITKIRISEKHWRNARDFLISLV